MEIISTSASDYQIQEIDYTKILHFGALIYITSFIETASSEVILNGDGFITRSLSLAQSNSCISSDFSGSLFKIVPPYSFSIQKEIAMQ